MSTRKTSEEWSKLLKRYRKSGNSQAAFCNRNNLSLATLQYHLKKDRQFPGRSTEIIPTGFVEIASNNSGSRVEIEFCLPSGAVLRVRG